MYSICEFNASHFVWIFIFNFLILKSMNLVGIELVDFVDLCESISRVFCDTTNMLFPIICGLISMFFFVYFFGHELSILFKLLLMYIAFCLT